MSKIAVVLKNTDQVTKKGNMMFDTAFADLEIAKKYVNTLSCTIPSTKLSEGVSNVDHLVLMTAYGTDGATLTSYVDLGVVGYEIHEYEVKESVN